MKISMFPLSLPESHAEFRLAVAEFSARRLPLAVKHFDRAEQLGYDADQCSAYRWDCWMLLGEFERAWRESDLISERGAPDPNGLWDRKPFADKRVIIRCLHGYGDAIQFIRYTGLMRAEASRIVVETHPEMVSLLSRLPFTDEVISWTGPATAREEWDQQIEVTELPRAYGTVISTIPAAVPYFNISLEAQQRSRHLLGKSSGPKVGLVWASSAWNPARCIPLAELLPVLRMKGCSFYSFQRGEPRVELEELRGFCAIHDTSFDSPEISDTAADLMNMDLLITVDTMAAHLAGALARRVWTLLPFAADWRWMTGRSDTPWYPTMRLFRQPSPGDWRPVVQSVADALACLLNSSW